MSNAVIHPLIDAAIIQLNSIRVLLGEESARFLIEGARTNLIAAKQMLGLDLKPTPKLPAAGRMGFTDFIDPPDEDEAQRVGEPVPKKKRKKKKEEAAKNAGQKKRRAAHHGNASRRDIRAAIIGILGNSSAPMSKNDIDDVLLKNGAHYGCPGYISIYMTKAAFSEMVKDGSMKKIGERQKAVYTLPK